MMKRRETELLEVDASQPDEVVIERAAEVLRGGGLVAFPTETVYGLGANALTEEAVAGIFEAKQRPATNPLIVHVAGVKQARQLAAEWPVAAEKLAEAFWPGPLTMVVQKASTVPDAVSAGLQTVALRFPAHPVARRLIEKAGVPVAAPSANRYTEVSPTTADHVMRGLEGRVDIVVDGGATDVGVESTLVSVVDSPVRILRPGMISCDQLEDVVEVRRYERTVVDEDEARPSPGMAARHYSPSTPVRVVDSSRFRDLLEEYAETKGFVGIDVESDRGEYLVVMPADEEGYARGLYQALHRLEEADVEEIIVQCPPEGTRWDAIRDRLARAATEVEGCRL